MAKKRGRKSKKNSNKTSLFLIIITVMAICLFYYINSQTDENSPETALNTYMSYIVQRDYEKMYDMLSTETKNKVEKETYLSRNKNIYEGIEISSISLNIVKTSKKNDTAEIIYQVTMQTIAGEINFSNTSVLTLEDDIYKLNWSSSEIFPDLKDNYKVRVETIDAERGKILDRNGTILAGKQTASQVGIVPGKINNDTKEDDIEKIAQLLNISADTIKDSLSESWVTSDTFVPLKTIRKSEQEIKNKLLEIKGVQINNKEERIYPLGEITSHLLGYTQIISKEELEQRKNEGYNAQSVIGKSGLERIFENRLKAVKGAEIYIVNEDSKKIKTIAKVNAKNGEDIKLTIDSKLQENLYNEFKDDKSAHVAINPKTGEILALVSTPTFDSNDFSLGMTTNKWNELSNNERKPMYNRFLASFPPGSSIKPIVGSIGLDTSIFTADEDFGKSTKKWQKDSSWGDFYITTLETYNEPSNLQNALIYSDNIYFAKAAIKIGIENFTNKLKDIGFNQKVDFIFDLDKSIYSNSDKITSEKQLANSGYGQAEMLVNPIHMSIIYSAFVNDGNMIMPYIEYKNDKTVTYYKKQAFNKETASTIKEALIQVVENKNGTAYSGKVERLKIAGKTGTAEIKASKDDKNGTEIGWFNSFIADEKSEKQLLIVSMVEDVQSRHGSHYVVNKIKNIYTMFK